jgi:anaerobic selenocysteine-containing dehydrogenase
MHKHMNTQKSKTLALLLPAAAALAMAAGAWGRSGPEHRTLRPLAMGNAFVAVADDKDAKNAPAIAKQAKALEDARNWEEARAAYQRLEKFRPYRSEAMYGQAWAAFQTSDAHMAEQIAGQLATEGGPYKIKAMFLYADAMYVQAQYARAKVIYQKLRTELHGEQRATAQKKIVACNKGLNLPENSGID